MNTTMADGAEQRLDAQIAEALFGQPGMSKMDVANRVRELRGDGPALLVDVQPGGSVRPGDWLPPLPPEVDAVRCMIRGEEDMAEACDYYYTADQMRDYARAALSERIGQDGTLTDAARAAIPFVAYAFSEGVTGAEEAGRAIEAALSAQPSQGGQGDAPWPEIDMILADAYSAGAEGLQFEGIARRAAVRAAVSALAARQPVGEPVAWYYGFSDTGEAGPVTFGGNPGAEAIAWAERHGHTLHYLYAAQPVQSVDLGPGVKAIAAERERQLQAEGFTRDGDQQYRRGELAKAATAYAQLAAMDLDAGGRDHIAWHGPAAVWPWAPEWWKPVDARRDLVRAGALIAAQIDVLDSKAVPHG